MTSEPCTVLALIDRKGEDRQVLRAVRALAAPRGSAVLVHIAPLVERGTRRGALCEGLVEPWERMRGIEATAHNELRDLAGPLRRAGLRVRTLVRFGDLEEEVAAVAALVGAGVVVAASRPAGFLAWRSRDHRLARTLGIPLALLHVRPPTGPGAPGVVPVVTCSRSPGRCA